MKKSMVRLMALALAVLMAVALGATTALAATTGVTTSKLNRRKTPSTSGTKNGTIAKGATVSIVDTISDGETYNGKKVSGDWYKLSNGDFVSADYVELEEEEAPDEEDEEEEEAPDESDEEEEEAPDESDGEVEEEIITDDEEDGDITIEGDDEEEVTIEGDDEEEEVPYDEEEEVPADEDEEEVPEDEDDETTVEEVPADEDTTTGTVKGTNLNVRATPFTSAKSLGKVTKGKVLTVTATYANGSKYNGTTVKNKWYEIEYNGGKGYVSADYVTLAGEKETTTTTTSSKKVTLSIKNTKTVYKTTQAVKAYAVPFTTGNVTKTVKSGTTVSVSKTIKSGSSYTGVNAKVSGDWYMIGTKQFIQAKYVKTSSSTSKSSVTITIGSTKLVTTDTVNQRARPSTSATSLGKLAKGSSFVVAGVYKDGDTYNGTKVSGNWVQVKGGGFISADYVKLG